MSKKEVEALDAIKKQLGSLEQFDFRLLKNVIIKLQELETRRRDDHVLLLRLSATVEELAKTSNDWKILRRTVIWLVSILAGLGAYIYGKE